MIKINADMPSSQGNSGSDETPAADYSRQPLYGQSINEKKMMRKFIEILNLITNPDGTRETPLDNNEKIAVLRQTIEILSLVPGISALGVKPFGDILEPYNGRSEFAMEDGANSARLMTPTERIINERVIILTDDSTGARGSGTNCSIHYWDKKQGKKESSCKREYVLFLSEGGKIMSLCFHSKVKNNSIELVHLVTFAVCDNARLLQFLEQTPGMVEHILYRLYLQAMGAHRKACNRAQECREAQDATAKILDLLRESGMRANKSKPAS